MAALTMGEIMSKQSKKVQGGAGGASERLHTVLRGRGDASLARHLLSQVQTEKCDAKGNTWVHQMAFKHTHTIPLASDAWTLETVTKLALRENDYQQNALHVAAFSGHAAGVLRSLPTAFPATSPAWPPAGVDALGGPGRKMTALAIAAERGHTADVQALLKANADPLVTVGEPVKDRLCYRFEQGTCRADACTFAHDAAELGAPRHAAKGTRTALHLAALAYDGSPELLATLRCLAAAMQERKRGSAAAQLECTLRECGEKLHEDLHKGFAAILPAPATRTRRPAPIAPWAPSEAGEKPCSDAASTSGSTRGDFCFTSPSSAWAPSEAGEKPNSDAASTSGSTRGDFCFPSPELLSTADVDALLDAELAALSLRPPPPPAELLEPELHWEAFMDEDVGRMWWWCSETGEARLEAPAGWRWCPTRGALYVPTR